MYFNYVQPTFIHLFSSFLHRFLDSPSDKMEKTHRSQLSDFEKGAIYNARQQGRTLEDIGREFHRDPKTILNVVNNIKKYGKPTRKPSSGRKRCTTTDEDNMVVKECEKNRTISAEEIKKKFNLKCHPNTIRNRLNENSLQSYRPRKKPRISKENQQKRVKWAKEHRKWGIRKWSRCLFADESGFCLKGQYPKRIWRYPNEALDEQTILPTSKFDKKVMIYGCFGMYGMGLLSKIEGTMNAKMYQQIMNEKMLPSAENIFQNKAGWIYVHDNDSKHTAIDTQEWFELHGVEVMKWPAQSPDLNPMENIWNILKQRVSQHRPNNIDELFLLIDQEWGTIDKKSISNLIKSMKKRCELVIKSNGLPIDY